MARNQMKRTPPRCSLDEFNDAVAYFSLAVATVERVRRVLVDGEALTWVASSEGITYPALSRACEKIMAKIDELRGTRPGDNVVATGSALPEGWREEVVVAPDAFLVEMRRQLDKYLKDHKMAGLRVG